MTTQATQSTVTAHELEQHWPTIRQVFGVARRSSMHFTIASINSDGTPHVSPIGSIFLTEPGRGFYFELFTRNLPRNLQQNQRICVMAVNSGKFFWLRSLFQGAFPQPPAIRLLGFAGNRRKATPEEQEQGRRMVAAVRFFKGYDLLWRKVDYVRDLFFDGFVPVRLGAMTKSLWTEKAFSYHQ
jgi:hypothetical protein